MISFIPALIAKNQKELDKRFEKVKTISKNFQIDIMDGKFVKNKSFDFNFSLPKKASYEAHLMMNNSLPWVKKNYNKFNLIILHIESNDFLDSFKYLRKKNKKIGIAIKPKTPLEKLKKFLKKINLVLVMTVNPGKYGSKFIPSTLNKISDLRKQNKKIIIEVDGNVNEKTFPLMKKAGANRFVVGSYFQNSRSIKKSLEKLK